MSLPTFEAFPKIARLQRQIVITEKIDGTNAQVHIRPAAEAVYYEPLYDKEVFIDGECLLLRAGSRSRWLSPLVAAANKNPQVGDNFGFATWVWANAKSLAALGPGRHFGEWWGQGIQRGYGLQEKRFSLFNTGMWAADTAPACCHVVPTLYNGLFDSYAIQSALFELKREGSVAAPGFMKPEGIVLYHVAAGVLFKQTIENDAAYKGRQV